MAKLSPIFNDPSFMDNNGDPLSGGKIFAYEAGSFSVLKATYTDASEDVQNANPIVLDSSGRGTPIWLTDGEAYNLVLTAADGTTVLTSFDDVLGVGTSSGGGGGSASLWVETAGATYLTTTSFRVTGNETANLAVGNRVRCTLTGGYVYGTISVVSFGGGNTTCTVVLDGGATLNSSLSLVEWSLLIRNGRTIEAGAVTYNSAITGPANTVNEALTTNATAIATTNTRVDALRKVWTASGTDTYAITPSPAVTSLAADAVFTVLFTNASTGTPTLNVNGLGATPLKVFNSSGALVDATISAGLVTDVAYNGTVFVLLDPIPTAASTVPRGMQVFTSNGTFTVPSGVSFITVTCAGAGGGGGGFYTVFGGESGDTFVGGGGGGGGATATSVISTTPGTTYSVSVGAGGPAGGSATAGTAGGSSSFGITLVIATGGAGGGSSTPTSAGGAGGNVGSVGTFISPGSSGGTGLAASTLAAAANGTGGRGGAALYGSGGDGQSNGSNGFVMVTW